MVDTDVTLPRIEPQRDTVEISGRDLATAQIGLPGNPRGAVTLLIDGDDIDSDVVDVMNGLAEHGYESLTICCAALTDADRHWEREVVGSALDLLRKREWHPANVGVLGIGSLSGRAALVAAARPGISAAISLSPTLVGGVSRLVATSLQAPWLGMFGEKDEQVSTAQFGESASSLMDARVYTQVVVYPGVGNDFYRGGAASVAHAAHYDCWQRAVEWLNLRVVPRPTPYAELWESRRGTR